MAPRHIQRLNESVKKTIDGVDGIRRLMVSMPPRHGKSFYCSQYLPSWFLGMNPDKRVILTSYEATFAASWGRKARTLLEEHGGMFDIKVATSPSAADGWDINGYQGGMVTAGAGGPITGKGAHLAIIDDPHKNAEEAASQVIRDKIWDWYRSTLYTRLEPDGVVIVIQTRWHEDDLCGRLIAEADRGDGEQWRMLKLPAIGSDGAALWPDRYSIDQLNQIRRAVGEYHWEALYQQNPTPREGGMFKVHKFQFIDAEPVEASWCRAWDLGATADDGDYTSGVKIGRTRDGRIIVGDVVRGQWATNERDQIIRHTAEMDGHKCRIRIPQDPGQAGKSQVLHMTRLLAGFSVKSLPVSGDKVTRADPFSSQVNAENVSIVRGAWNRDYIEELRQFDKGKHDDSVDASSDAFNEVNQFGRVTALIADTPRDLEPQPGERTEPNRYTSLVTDDYLRDTWERIIREESVVPQWRDSFVRFRDSMGKRPSKEHVVKLRDVNDSYGPENCYWGVEGQTEVVPPKKRKLCFVAE